MNYKLAYNMNVSIIEYIEMNNIPSRPSSKLLILVIMFVFISVVCLGIVIFS